MATATSHPGQASLPPGLTPGVLDTRPVPAGWTRVLNGQVFNGTATSPADPRTLAGCPLPAQLAAVAAAAPPVLVLSTDGGVTWQSHPIPGADETQGCAVLADTEHAGTYIVDTETTRRTRRPTPVRPGRPLLLQLGIPCRSKLGPPRSWGGT